MTDYPPGDWDSQDWPDTPPEPDTATHRADKPWPGPPGALLGVRDGGPPCTRAHCGHAYTRHLRAGPPVPGAAELACMSPECGCPGYQPPSSAAEAHQALKDAPRPGWPRTGRVPLADLVGAAAAASLGHPDRAEEIESRLTAALELLTRYRTTLHHALGLTRPVPDEELLTYVVDAIRHAQQLPPPVRSGETTTAASPGSETDV